MLRKIKLYFKIGGVKAVLCFLKTKFRNSTVIFAVNKKDYNYPFYLRINSSDISTYKQIFVKEEYNFTVINQPKVIVDAGANIGLASIYFANKYPDAKILSIEPEKNNVELLKKNVEFYPNIIPVHAALWNKNEQIKVIDPGLGNWGFMTAKKKAVDDNGEQSYQTVKSVSIDSLMTEYNLDQIDILKIDIEGAEKEVFSDTSSWITKVNAIIIELHERMKPGCNRSFYCGSNGFDAEWKQGENLYLSRKNFIKKRV